MDLIECISELENILEYGYNSNRLEEVILNLRKISENFNKGIIGLI
jgi:hypothetical protein